MRRSIYIPIALIVSAISVVAFVRAQEWSNWSTAPSAQQYGVQSQLPATSQPGQGFGQQVQSVPAMANQPNQFAPQDATPVPSRFAQQQHPAGRFGQQPPQPLMIENRFVTESTPNTVVPAQATMPSPSDPTQAHPAPASSRRQAETPPPRFTNVNEPTALQQPPSPTTEGVGSRLVQATEELTSSNQSNAIHQGPSSRRPRSLRETHADSAANDGESEPNLPPTVQGDEPKLPPINPQATEETTQPSVSSPSGSNPGVSQPRVALPEQEAGNNVLIQAEAPALAVTMAGPAKIGVGKSSKYEISIINNSTVDAEDVILNLDLPGWAEVTANEATLGSARHETVIGDHGRIRWNLFRLEANSTEKLTLTLVARESRSFEMAVNWTHAPKAQITRIEVQEPKLEMVLQGPRDVLYGETKTYTITVSNPGNGPAENVVLNLLPVTPGQDKAGVSNLGTIEAGGRREIEIDLTARQAGALELRAHAFADGGLRTEASEQIHVRRGELEAVVGGPEIKYAGTVASYQVRVANTGDAMAENVMAEAIMPRNANFVSATDGGAVDEGTGRVQWQIGGLRPGATRVFELRCVLAESGSNRLEIITMADDDLTSAAHFNTRVEALADLKLLINDPQGPLPAGEPMVYEVRLINRGTNAADGVQIASFFSEGIEPISIEGGRADIGIGQVVFHPIPRVAAGQELVFRITAKAETGGNHTFRTEVVCTSPETKLAAQETTRFYGGAVENALSEGEQPKANLATPQFNTSRFGDRR